MDISTLILHISNVVLGWPLMLFVISVGIVYTIALGGIQFRYLFSALKATFVPSGKGGQTGDMTPFQAFINTINTNLGNGSIAGMATAIYVGGPGAALWVVFFGFILMSVRFAEVYISTQYGMREHTNTALGGPMLYLRSLPAGTYWAYAYTLFCLLFALIVGNSIQANSISISLETTWSITPFITAVILFFFMLYTTMGGAARIVALSIKIVPLKVAVFLVSSTTVLLYHYHALAQALRLIFEAGCGMYAFGAGMLGFTLQQAIRYGMERSIMATESGVGTAAILFGFTESHDPVKSGFMGMVSTFLSTIVCFIVALCIVASGVWDCGATSTALTISAFNTVFGSYGGWIVSFLSVSFGIGVLVSNAYVARAAWLFLFNGRCIRTFGIVYCLFSFAGAVITADVVWNSGGIILAGMLVINLVGLLYLLPETRKDVRIRLHEKHMQ